MHDYMRSMGAFAICASVVLAQGCASRITTENSVVATICEIGKPEMLSALGEVVSGMKNHKVIPKGEAEVLVRYDPSNPIMGSATLQVRASSATGISRDGKRLAGTELVYTDVTPFLSQDTSFGGADIIDRLKSSMDEYTNFKGIPCTQARRE